MKTPTNLYRHFDKDDVLLYVGISLSAVNRTAQHVHQSDWAKFIARIEIETYPSRDAALAAEREAILAEHPVFNTVHNGGRKGYVGEEPIVNGAARDRTAAFRPPIEEGDEWLFSRQVSKMLGSHEQARHLLPPSAQHVVFLPGGPRGGVYYWRRSDVERCVVQKESAKASIPFVRHKSPAPKPPTSITIDVARKDPCSVLRIAGLDPALFSKEEAVRLACRYVQARNAA